MDEPAADRPSHARVRPVVRFAGVLLAVVGLVNLGLGIVGLATDEVRLTETSAAVLATLGVLTVGLGALVAAGRRWAMVAALVLFGGLFAVQAFGATGGAPAPAVVTLAVVLVPLVLALRATRPADD